MKKSPLGTAEVRAVFKLPRAGGSIAGSYISSGKVVRGANVRVKRGGKQVFEGKIDTLKREKDDVREVAQGFECGILIPGYDPAEPVNEVRRIRLSATRCAGSSGRCKRTSPGSQVRHPLLPTGEGEE